MWTCSIGYDDPAEQDGGRAPDHSAERGCHGGSGAAARTHPGDREQRAGALRVSHLRTRHGGSNPPPKGLADGLAEACEGDRIYRVGREAAREVLDSAHDLRGAIAAWRPAAAPFHGLRFHDLRHQAITEMAEAGASDATLMAVAGHMSRRMLEHYSHVRMAAKRAGLDKLESGPMGRAVESQAVAGKVN
jgi:integrase